MKGHPGGEVLVFPLLPIARHSGLSALVVFHTRPIVPVLSMPVKCLLPKDLKTLQDQAKHWCIKIPFLCSHLYKSKTPLPLINYSIPVLINQWRYEVFRGLQGAWVHLVWIYSLATPCYIQCRLTVGVQQDQPGHLGGKGLMGESGITVGYWLTLGVGGWGEAAILRVCTEGCLQGHGIAEISVRMCQAGGAEGSLE